MRVKSYREVEGEREPTARGVLVRKLISEEDLAPNYIMRRLEVDIGGNTPQHSHPWEHEVYILEGEGVVKAGNEEKKIEKGDSIFIAPNEGHQFVNKGEDKLVFICVIPRTKLTK